MTDSIKYINHSENLYMIIKTASILAHSLKKYNHTDRPGKQLYFKVVFLRDKK